MPSARPLAVFMQTSLDGYFCDLGGDMSFAHKPLDDTEWHAFVTANASSESTLVFGRRTYELMANWWPTPAAVQAMPDVAGRMNASPKLVFSRTLNETHWPNTTLVKGELVTTIGRMKREPGAPLVVLGSGSIVTQLVDAGLVDTVQLVVNPVALGNGHSFLAGLQRPLNLSLTRSRTFTNGSVVLWYRVQTS